MGLWFTGTSTTWSDPSYGGTSNPYLSATSSLRNLVLLSSLSSNFGHRPTHLPPTKCVLPRNHFTSGFGAVRLTSTSGMKSLPGPSFGGPVSIFHDEGASTDVTGRLVAAIAAMTDGNGSRTSPENEKPKMASRTWSFVVRAAPKSVVKGIWRFRNWLVRRWGPLD